MNAYPYPTTNSKASLGPSIDIAQAVAIRDIIRINGVIRPPLTANVGLDWIDETSQLTPKNTSPVTAIKKQKKQKIVGQTPTVYQFWKLTDSNAENQQVETPNQNQHEQGQPYLAG